MVAFTTVPSFAPPVPTHSKGFVRSFNVPNDPVSQMLAENYPEAFEGKNVDDHPSRFAEGRPGGYAIGNTTRPSDIRYKTTKQANWWYVYARMYQYREEVSLLSTLISRSVTELTRHKIIFSPKFYRKCEDCGYESKTLVKKCPECGSTRLRKPDESQKEYFKRPNGKSFIDEANNNGQSLKDVIRSYSEMQYLCNQGYLLCVARDLFDPLTGSICTIEMGEGKREAQVFPTEFISLDPMKVQQLYDDSGTLGRTYGFTLDDRHTAFSIQDDIDQLKLATEEGKEIYYAAYRVGENIGAAGQNWYYMQHEIYQDHWLRPSLTYGIPTWFDIEDDLQAWHYIEKSELKKRKFGYARKLVILPGFGEDSVEEVTKGITDVLATNDNSIPIICPPPQLAGVAEMRAQVLDLMSDATSDMLASKDNIMNRLCAFIGVPNLFAGDVEQSGGMNNESQQITVFDRFLKDKYEYLDNLLKWILEWFPQITDWELIIDRPTKAESDAKKRVDRMQEAQLMKQLGFDIEYQDGSFYYSDEPVDQIMRREQMAQQQQAMQMQMMQQMAGPEGGIIPGDGEGPPEKGTARRDDPEIDESKNEIEQSMREAM